MLIKTQWTGAVVILLVFVYSMAKCIVLSHKRSAESGNGDNEDDSFCIKSENISHTDTGIEIIKETISVIRVFSSNRSAWIKQFYNAIIIKYRYILLYVYDSD